MEIRFDDASAAEIKQHLAPENKLILTFEDGVGPYSQHAMIHMQVQFTLGIIGSDMSTESYDQSIPSNLGEILVEGYSLADLDEHMNIRFDASRHILSLTGDSGLIDGNLGLIDFTESNNEGIKKNPAR